MTDLTYPSEQFPALTSLTMTIPEEWTPLTAVGVHLGAGRIMPAGEFTPNVIVEISRFGGVYTLKQAIDLAQRNVSAARGYKATRREAVTVAGSEGYMLEGTFPQPRGGGLMQMIRLAVLDRGSVVDLIQVTGTCEQAQEGTAWAQIQDIAESISVASAGAN